MGTFSLSASNFESYYLQAQKVRQLVRQDFDLAFTQAHVLLTPTAKSAAVKFEVPSSGSSTVEGVQSYLNDVFTVPSSLAGLPSMSVPAGIDHANLPLGLQLITPKLHEARLFQVGKLVANEE